MNILKLLLLHFQLLLQGFLHFLNTVYRLFNSNFAFDRIQNSLRLDSLELFSGYLVVDLNNLSFLVFDIFSDGSDLVE